MKEMRESVLSAGAVVVRFAAGEPRLLMLRAYKYWDFPKGIAEKGEAPLEAALREVEEETGLRDLIMRWGPVFRETEPYGRGKVARYYLAESRSGTVFLPVNPDLGRPEHHEFRWLSIADARSLAVPRLQAIVDWASGILGSTDSRGRA